MTHRRQFLKYPPPPLADATQSQRALLRDTTIFMYIIRVLKFFNSIFSYLKDFYTISKWKEIVVENFIIDEIKIVEYIVLIILSRLLAVRDAEIMVECIEICCL